MGVLKAEFLAKATPFRTCVMPCSKANMTIEIMRGQCTHKDSVLVLSPVCDRLLRDQIMCLCNIHVYIIMTYTVDMQRLHNVCLPQ